MKHALVVGGGSKNNQAVIDCLLEHDYSVVNIGSSQHVGARNIVIDWSTLDIPSVHKICKFDCQFDFVFFGQNSSSLNYSDYHPDLPTIKTWRLLKDWSHSHWISCQMPFLIIHSMKKNLHSDTKIGWMLSDLIDYQKAKVNQFPDYSTNKFQNYLQMSNFAQYYKTFGILPDFAVENSRDILKSIIVSVLKEKNLDKTLYRFYNINTQ